MLPKMIKIVEVGPRDGLQNESQNLSVQTKVELIRRLADTGLQVIEAGSFTSPKWVPQMADSGEVLGCLNLDSGINYPVLVPNMRGLDGALEAGAKEVAIFAAASESFSKKNINRTIDESLESYQSVVERALASNLKVRGYVSCVLGCPYEGEITTEAVSRVVTRLNEMGCYEISLGDTIGVGTPMKVQALIKTLSENIPIERLAVHFHDTYGQGLANVFAALQLGISVVDSAVSGLGGCPYAKGASGNLATEDLVYMLQGMQIETGVDLDRLITAGSYICDKLQRPTASRVAQALRQN
ncbi:MAG: hydroxymethylglutaryl-CoA lyase [Gammaproteobacteria bacterium]|nr:hydroxymethylglutaryl-CoA lyase [Gammaproteobacteria bacterium]